jgi:membrane protein YqaA with SNARE-associated domain
VSDLAAYAGLFAIAFLAATVLAAQSEAALVALILADQQPVAELVAAASLGNTLGAVVNWALGRGVARFSGRRWFPLSPEQLSRASGWYRRWGRFSLLLSWAPLVGDALTVAAGVLREPFWSFLALVAVAKTGRYLVLAAAALSWI